MEIKFEFPEKIKEFAQEHDISTKEVEEKINQLLWEDLLDENY